MKKYTVKLKSGSKGISAISLVTSPATEEDFIKLSKDEPVLKLEADKMIVTGAVLVPDKEIYRDATFCKGESTISFDADTILEMSKLFLRGDIDDKQTIQHMFPTDKADLIESWVIADADKDKTVALGMNLPVGTWVVSYQITDVALWESIQEGNLNGFSIEASEVEFIELSAQDEYASQTEIDEFYAYVIDKAATLS